MSFPDIDFNHIRQFEGSKRNAFEELCCQLFHMQPPDNNAKFFRKKGAGGDAGVEAYWLLPDGSEHGIQAKYFPDSFGNPQWSQIDRSVKAAIEKHPKITEYIICLPIDLTDSRAIRSGRKNKSQKDTWDDYVIKWNELCSQQGIANINFVLWGSHEIKQLLIEQSANPKIAGIIYYWFDETIFTLDWFKKRIDLSESDLGERYTPNINVEIPLTNIFHGLVTNSNHFQALTETLKNIIKDLKYAVSDFIADLNKDSCQRVDKEFKEIINSLELIVERPEITSDEYCTNNIRSQLKQYEDIINQLFNESDHLRIHKVQVNSLIRKILDLLNSKSIKASQKRVLFLKGDAGVGKSHALCDIAKRHIDEDLPAILLLAQHMCNGNIEKWILNQLDISNRFDSFQSFLSTLEHKAIVSNGRALLLIDAINESENRTAWKNSLLGFIEQIRQFQNIAIVVSCRSTFWDYSIPENVVGNNDYVIVEHYGFRGIEYDVASVFGIDLPDVPILRPEFSNPLFLKTFAKAYADKPLPRGQAFSNIYDTYLDVINKTISARLDLDPTENIIHRALTTLIAAIYPENLFYIDKGKAKEITEKVYSTRNGYSRSLLFMMIDQGLLVEEIFKDFDSGQEVNVVRFQFERHKDYYLTKYLIDNYFDVSRPEEFFVNNEKTNIIFGENKNIYLGLWEELMIILPEKYGKELYCYIEDFYPDRIEGIIYETFNVYGNSIVWRQPEATSDITLKWFNRSKVGFTQKQWYLLNSATIVGNIFNAYSLHRNLISKDLNIRDAIWGIYFSNNYFKDEEEVSPIYQIVNWALKRNHNHSCCEIAYLVCIVLCWLFISSNRLVRDKATKALTNLLNSQPRHIMPLIDLFKDVNDPYLTERLYAGVYGAIVHCQDKHVKKEVAFWFYKNVFTNENVIPLNILIRDYSRNIIEKAYFEGLLEQDILINKIRPPYKSNFPEDIFSDEENKKIAESKGDFDIYDSIYDGDFGTYVLSEIFRWSATHIEEERLRTKKDFLNEFWERIGTLKNADQIITLSKSLPNELRHPNYKEKKSEDDETEISAELVAQLLESIKVGKYKEDEDRNVAEQKICELLPPHELELFRWLKGTREIPQFSRRRAKRWICNRAYNLGWEKVMFFDFENAYIRSCERGAHVKERIGKKYQWIAFYEYLGYLADNYHFIGRYYDEKEHKYYGPWQLSKVRKIDPTFWGETSYPKGDCKYNYIPYKVEHYDNKTDKECIENWLIDTSDLANSSDILTFNRSNDHEEYLVLSASSNNNLSNDVSQATAYDLKAIITISSYLVSNKDIEKFKKQVLKDSCHSLLFEQDLHNSFIGDYYWHPDVKIDLYETNESYEYPCFYNVFKYYLPFSEYDFSRYDLEQASNRSILTPSIMIANFLGLRLKSGNEVAWITNQGEPMYSYIVDEENDNAIAAIKRAVLEKFLVDNGFNIAWHVSIQKSATNNIKNECIGEVNYHGVYTLKNGLLDGNLEERNRYFYND